VDTLTYKTISANVATVNKEWIVIDAKDEVLGRLSSVVAKFLRGKYKASFTPHVDCGDNVIIINADKIVLTGTKWADKEYIYHTGYPGGQKKVNVSDRFAKNPCKVIEIAVKGMIPKNRLGKVLFNNLHVYQGEVHPHEAQNPKIINLKSVK